MENTRLATLDEIKTYLDEVNPIYAVLDKKVPYKYQKMVVLKTDVDKLPPKFKAPYIELTTQAKKIKEKHRIVTNLGNDMRKMK